MLDGRTGLEMPRNELDGDILCKAFCSLPQINDAHAAATEQPLQPERTKHPANPEIARGIAGIPCTGRT